MSKDKLKLTMVLYRKLIYGTSVNGPIHVRGRNLYLNNSYCTSGVLLIWDDSKYVNLEDRRSVSIAAIMEEDVYANVIDHFCLEVMP